jgi:hypothetical protein
VFQPTSFANLESLLARNGYEIRAQEPGIRQTDQISYSNTVALVGFAAAILGVVAAIIAGFISTK